MSRLLITGGAGFIGSHLVHAAVARGHAVTVIDDLSTGQQERLAEVAGRIRFIEASLLDDAALDDALAGVEAVLHQAALPSVPKSIALPLVTHRANAEGTLALLDACHRHRIHRLVYAASSSAYGDQPAASKSETLNPRPLSPYAVQKLAGEDYCRVFHHLFGVETIGLRYFNVFGPRQDPRSVYAAVIPAFITGMLRGERPNVYGDGHQSRDFTFVENIVDANFAALAAPAEACGRVYNAACGMRTSLLELVTALNGVLGTDLAPRFLPARPGDVLHSCADVRAAAAALSWRPAIQLAEGLRRTVAWYRAVAAATKPTAVARLA
ncbi:MAG: NAD-dependent epimerase/dehydratase family protein [Myxococcales bacterium]|nr:NAD-dependent epimerase/dehydratase family protein [Myxococcales bacterium]